MKVAESLLGFKDKKSPILEHRNSILRILILLNVPNILILVLWNQTVTEPYMDE